VLHKSPGECDDVTLTMRGFAKRNAGKKEYNAEWAHSDDDDDDDNDDDDDEKRGRLLLLRPLSFSLVLSRGYALTLTA